MIVNRSSHSHVYLFLARVPHGIPPFHYTLNSWKGLEMMLAHSYVSEFKTRGGHSHRHCVQSCDRGQNAVKRSRHFLGIGQTVKRCSRPYLRYSEAAKRRGRDFAHAQLIDSQRVKGKNLPWSSGQGQFWMVKNLDRGRSSGPPLSKLADTLTLAAQLSG